MNMWKSKINKCKRNSQECHLLYILFHFSFVLLGFVDFKYAFRTSIQIFLEGVVL